MRDIIITMSMYRKQKEVNKIEYGIKLQGFDLADNGVVQ